MSISNIESDYTPKDFLQKLLGKTFTPEPFIEESLESKPDNSNSQSTIEDTNPSQVLSPKANYANRVHFQSVQNITLSVSGKEPNTLDSKHNFQFKENLRKKSLKKQPALTFSAKEIKSGFRNPLINENQDKEKILGQDIRQKSVETEQQLVLQKTKLILKSILKYKIDSNQINSIITSISNGIQNGTEFDKLVSSSSIEPNENQVISDKDLKQESRSVIRSKSVDYQSRNGQLLTKRIKSVEKGQSKKMSKKQMKQKAQQGKQQILKSIKKIKQLVFLNQKSLKMTRRM